MRLLDVIIGRRKPPHPESRELAEQRVRSDATLARADRAVSDLREMEREIVTYRKPQ